MVCGAGAGALTLSARVLFFRWIYKFIEVACLPIGSLLLVYEFKVVLIELLKELVRGDLAQAFVIPVWSVGKQKRRIPGSFLLWVLATSAGCAPRSSAHLRMVS